MVREDLKLPCLRHLGQLFRDDLSLDKLHSYLLYGMSFQCIYYGFTNSSPGKIIHNQHP